jgi:DNA polymerase IV
MIQNPGSPLDAKVSHGSIFSTLPLVFILPTHVSLEELDEAEGRLMEHGGKLTYEISEANIIVGKVGRPKRAALELRSRGLWTEEVIPLPKSAPKITSSIQQPPTKRRKTEKLDEGSGHSVEIIDLSTESETEENASQSRHDTTLYLAKEKQLDGDLVTVLKLEWLDASIQAGMCIPHEPFMIYRGRKIPTPSTTGMERKFFEEKSSQIIERAKMDTGLPQSSVQMSDHRHARRSKESSDGPSSQRHRPKLYRQTTSEHDENDSPPPKPDWVRDQVLFACLRSAPLHPPNEEFISQLLKIRRIRELTLDQIGVRAYSTSIASLAAYPYVIRRPSEILALPGCDVKIANLFAQWQQHGGCEHTDDDGNVAAADALESDPVLRVLNSFYEIWGVGAKTAREFYYHRGWRNLDDIVEHGWSTLSRVQQIGVKFYDEFQEGVSRAESESIADVVREHANRVRPEGDDKIDCIIVGGYRRGKEYSGDVDIILTHRDDTVTKNLIVDVVASLEKCQFITHTLALHLTSSHREQQTLPFHGEDSRNFDTLDKALVVWHNPHFSQDLAGSAEDQRKRNPNPHRRVDIIISPWRTVGCAVLGWSGDTTFQRDLRRHAKKACSWKFDSSGVRARDSTGQVVDLENGGETWEQRERLVMERIGIGWRAPQERCSR